MALARATAWAAEQQDSRAAVEAWRYLGALRWDLADDRIGADEAFFVACAIDPEAGAYRYAMDLCGRAGPKDAFPVIVERAGEMHRGRIDVGKRRRLVFQFRDDAFGDFRANAGRARHCGLVA